MDLLHIALYFTLVCISTYFLFYMTRSSKRSTRNQLPPGPSQLSVYKNILQLKEKPNIFFSQLAKVYGPVMSFKIGCVTTVVISLASMAKEVLIKNDASFCGRTAFTAMTVLNHNDTSVAFSAANAHWRDLRKICKNYLFSKDRLDATQGDLADPNVTPDFWELVSGMLHVAGIPNIADYFPILKMVDPRGIRRYMSDCYQKATGVFREAIAQRLESRRDEALDKKGDMLDVLLDAIKENEDTNFKEFELPNLLYNYGTTYWYSQELIVGGTDTT
ncbi:Ferruginol synthase-like protein [Drosera capensis]